MDVHRFTRVTTAVGLLGLASLALVGCQQESRYCDDTGCFYCDGLGCRTVTPPARPACGCDYECNSGSDCTSLGCTTECTEGEAGTEYCHSLGWPRCAGGFCVGNAETLTDTTCTCTTTDDCEDGLVCREGECRPGCQSSSDCADGQICLDGTCQASPHHGCSETEPCAAGSSCVDGQCRTDDDTCQFNSECGPGRVCVNERCTSTCNADIPCPSGAVCEDGFCVEDVPPVGECVLNGDCGPGERCIDTRCHPGCTTTADCAPGNYCDVTSGVCRYDDLPRPTCGAMAACAAGSVCRNGSCRSPCNEDSECPRFDVQFNFCIENVCATTNEATSDCTTQSDCNAGRNCIDGICR